jgi:hypothetical protein
MSKNFWYSTGNLKMSSTIKVKQSHNTPMEEQRGRGLELLLIHDLGT